MVVGLEQRSDVEVVQSHRIVANNRRLHLWRMATTGLVLDFFCRSEIAVNASAGRLFRPDLMSRCGFRRRLQRHNCRWVPSVAAVKVRNGIGPDGGAAGFVLHFELYSRNQTVYGHDLSARIKRQ